MVPKRRTERSRKRNGFRAVLFRMVPKHPDEDAYKIIGFRAVLFRMVPKLLNI